MRYSKNLFCARLNLEMNNGKIVKNRIDWWLVPFDYPRQPQEGTLSG
ncbi:MAG: hypothetical protein LV471_09595 [Nitrosomonas sp.]|nr:hypothetical protein [Nitrosomonas sp.]